MAETVPDGNTALLDGIYVGLKKMNSARYSRRALLIVSDGGDNHSYYNAKKIKRLAEEADVMIYSIGLFDNMPVPVFKTIEEKLGQSLLTGISELTGGFTLAADKREKVPEIAAEISRALREQYVLAYRPKHALHDGKWKKIKVQLVAPQGSSPLRVDYKRGYISPG
jgi:Ca-activated chloride channel family protein